MNNDRDTKIELAKQAGFTEIDNQIYLLLREDEHNIDAKLSKLIDLVSAHTIASMQTEQPIDYEKNIAWQNGHEIADTDSYFNARPQIDTTDRRRVFESGHKAGWKSCQEQFKYNTVTSMQGDSEPVAYLRRSKMTDRAISMLPTKVARDSEQAKGWSEWKPASIKDFEQHQQSIGKSDWMHDIEFIPLFTHDTVKGVSDELPEAIDEDSLVSQLRAYANNSGYSHLDYSDTMKQAADVIERSQLSTEADNFAYKSPWRTILKNYSQHLAQQPAEQPAQPSQEWLDYVDRLENALHKIAKEPQEIVHLQQPNMTVANGYPKFTFSYIEIANQALQSKPAKG